MRRRTARASAGSFHPLGTSAPQAQALRRPLRFQGSLHASPAGPPSRKGSVCGPTMAVRASWAWGLRSSRHSLEQQRVLGDALVGMMRQSPSICLPGACASHTTAREGGQG